MALPAEVRAQYIVIIDSILHGADLTTISAKKVRNGIQDRVQYDITPHKTAITALIGERFDLANARQAAADGPPVPSIESTEPTVPVAVTQTNGVHKPSIATSRTASISGTPAKREASSEDHSDVVDRAPPKKKRKASVESDAAIAARLQAEEDHRARPTRGGAHRKTAPVKKKKTPKKKTSSKVTGSDDSDLEENGEPKPKRDTGFHKPLNLSQPLSNLLDGETQMSRPQVTKRLWQYIKAHDLQEPSDKRYIRCDDRLRDIFRQDRVHMFTMTKLVSQQMYNPDE